MGAWLLVYAHLGEAARWLTLGALMMAVIGLSLPEAVILRKVLTMRLILVFFGVVTLGILCVGNLFNLVIPTGVLHP